MSFMTSNVYRHCGNAARDHSDEIGRDDGSGVSMRDEKTAFLETSATARI
jgi:hypothetical protein